MKKTIFFGFICAVLFIACSSDDEDSITRNPQKITYAQGTHVYEISNDVGTLTLENFPASKTLFLAKTNPTETIVPMANTHYIASGTNVSLNSTGVYSRSAEAAADSSAQSQEHSRTCYSMHLAEIAQKQHASRLRSASPARSASTAELTDKTKSYAVGDTKFFYLDSTTNDDDTEILWWSEGNATLEAIGKDAGGNTICYVWVLGEVKGYNSDNSTKFTATSTFI